MPEQHSQFEHPSSRQSGGCWGPRFDLIGGADYWMEMVKCQDACPVHTDACGYVIAIAEGRYEDAYRLARARNPFASICGRVCGAPCEANCRRGSLDSPVAIRALKRFVTEQFGPESGDASLHRDAYDPYYLPPDLHTREGAYATREGGCATRERIAVVGAGVSGLTVAHDLARLGYKVTIFEADSQPGGMLTTGVPVFRLPRELVRAEINAILSLGVELKCNRRLGRDFSLADLRAQGFAAIFLGIGLPKGRKLSIPGADLPFVYDGMDFLRAFNENKPLLLGKRIVVIGGGNVAYDVARSAVRPLRPASHAEVRADMERGETIAYDVARSALRLSGDKEVHVVCLEKREEMPADETEIAEGAEEGLHLHNARGPKEIIARNGQIAALRTIQCVSVFDASRRFNPSFDESDVEDILADTVIFAIGQASDLSFLKPEDGIEIHRGLIKVNPDTYQTTAPDVFACGDIAHGPRLFINAIASAQVAARSLHDFLRGTRTEIVVRSAWHPAVYSMAQGWESRARQDPPVINAAERASSLHIIEETYSPAAARAQASRCLRCNVNTVFETAMCVACTGCVDVCPERLIQLVGLGELISNDGWGEYVAGALGRPLAELQKLNPAELDQLGGVMLKDESTCIRCGLCAARCPSYAIAMKRFDFRRECVSYPAPNPKLNYASTPAGAKAARAVAPEAPGVAGRSSLVPGGGTTSDRRPATGDGAGD